MYERNYFAAPRTPATVAYGSGASGR
jgi:hypothetical protein